MPGHIPGIGTYGLIDHRTQEVVRVHFAVRVSLAGTHVRLRDARNVAPQRRPLVLLVPDVRTLERGDLVVLFALEQLSRTSGMRFHLTTPRASPLVLKVPSGRSVFRLATIH